MDAPIVSRIIRGCFSQQPPPPVLAALASAPDDAEGLEDLGLSLAHDLRAPSQEAKRHTDALLKSLDTEQRLGLLLLLWHAASRVHPADRWKRQDGPVDELVRLLAPTEVLRAVVERAFATAPMPSGPIECALADEEVQQDFGGRAWASVPLRVVRYHRGDLSFFTAPAFRYYLPAFLLAALPPERDGWGIGGNLVFAFSEPSEDWAPRHNERVRLLARGEKRAVLAFLWYREYLDPEDDAAAIAYAERSLGA